MLLEALLFLLLLGFLIYQKTTKPRGMPPGSFGLPVVGCLPPQELHMTKHLQNLKEKYGNIFTTKWGSRVVVVVAEHELIKKAYNHPHFQGRPDFFTMKVASSFRNAGVIASEGKQWADNRRFLIRHLRDLGMGKTKLEASIQDEALMLVQYLEKHNLDQPMELDWTINVAIVNIIWQMLASKRYEADDAELIELTRLTAEDFDIIQGPVFLMDVMPWLLNIIPKIIQDKFMQVGLLFQHRDVFHLVFERTIKEHRETLDRNNPRDCIDFYIMQIEDTKDDPETSFIDDVGLLVVMSDMFTAGSETTSTTLRWLILYMAVNQEIQDKVHNILDAVVPEDRLPSLDDRNELVYIDALLLDVLRMSSFAPTSVPHEATETVIFEGYTIPKGTIILACLEICHHDPALWEKPDTLYPEHFIDESGKLIVKKDGFMPFSTGRRQCLGESLARMELFLFASAILQRFTISPPPGVTLDTKTDPTKKLINTPKPFKVVLKKRLTTSK